MIILDGGLGRQLKSMGAPFRQPEWSALALMEGPKYVRAAHDAFIKAGADIITTNSYAIVPFHIGDERFAKDAEDLLMLSGQLARDAAIATSAQVQVAGGIPPMFGSYQPGKFDYALGSQMMQIFQRCLAPYVDFYMAETLGSIDEARCFLDAFTASEKPVWVSLTLEDEDPVVGQPKLRSGELLADFLGFCDGRDGRAMPSAVLFNCSQPEVMEDAVRVTAGYFAAQETAPLIGVYANAFPLMKKDYEGANADLHEIRGDITPDAYADYADIWVEAGAGIIGGCCGISPDHLRVLKQRLIPEGPCLRV